jgi:hypothetical protein
VIDSPVAEAGVTLSINFSKDMKAVLKQKAPEYRWKVDWPADGEKWLVDVAGIPKKGPWILVEVELKRDDPVGNVVKIWQWARQRKIKNKIVLFQAFSKHYWEKRERLRLRAEFIGEQMSRDPDIAVRYALIPMKNYRPGKGKTQGAGRRTHHARRLARTVLRLIKKPSLRKLLQ